MYDIIAVTSPNQQHFLWESWFPLLKSDCYQWEFPPFLQLPMQCQPSIDNSEYEKDVPLSVIQTQKSAYELSGPSGPSLCQFLQHEATRSISTRPGWNACPLQGYPQPLILQDPFKPLGGERHCKSCVLPKDNFPGLGLKLDYLILIWENYP